MLNRTSLIGTYVGNRWWNEKVFKRNTSTFYNTCSYDTSEEMKFEHFYFDFISVWDVVYNFKEKTTTTLSVLTCCCVLQKKSR